MSTKKNAYIPRTARPDRKPADEQHMAKVRHLSQIICNEYLAKSGNKDNKQPIDKTFEKFKGGGV